MFNTEILYHADWPLIITAGGLYAGSQAFIFGMNDFGAIALSFILNIVTVLGGMLLLDAAKKPAVV